ncbi:RING finger type zinc finger protein [uncultured virus]|nr:RING finger type zinc finger protein [uncultured virus]
MNRRKGDWNCPQCNYLIFASKNKCSKCNISKPSNLSDKKPGDWSCSCGEINFASRKQCRKCNQEKQVEEKTVSFKPGDWFCDTCNELNFKSRINCRKCGKIRKDHNILENNEYSDRDNCIVCLDKVANICIKKCGHLGLCEACSYQLNKCPICRITFELPDLLKIYKV